MGSGGVCVKPGGQELGGARRCFCEAHLVSLYGSGHGLSVIAVLVDYVISRRLCSDSFMESATFIMSNASSEATWY
jgi:hypothetical protein